MLHRLARTLPVSLLAVLLARTAGVAQAGPQIDSVRLLTELSVLANDSMAGRLTGSSGAAKARAFLTRALSSSGAEPVGEKGYLQTFRWERGVGTNVVGLVPGRVDPRGIVVLTAHYDHLGVRDGEIYNGADDNASGSAALLEIARRVASAPLDHTLLLALVDAEEEGLHGSRAILTDELVPPERILLNVNLDMVARTYGVLWAAGAYHTPELRPVLERVAAEAPLTLKLGHDRPNAPEGDDWTDASDHGPFHEAGIPFVYFGVEDHPDYHQPTDDFERIDPGEYVASVRTILIALRALDAALPLDSSSAR